MTTLTTHGLLITGEDYALRIVEHLFDEGYITSIKEVASPPCEHCAAAKAESKLKAVTEAGGLNIHLKAAQKAVDQYGETVAP